MVGNVVCNSPVCDIDSLVLADIPEYGCAVAACLFVLEDFVVLYLGCVGCVVDAFCDTLDIAANQAAVLFLADVTYQACLLIDPSCSLRVYAALA